MRVNPKEKLQRLLNSVNDITEKEDADLTKAIASLVEGYGRAGDANLFSVYAKGTYPRVLITSEGELGLEYGKDSESRFSPRRYYHRTNGEALCAIAIIGSYYSPLFISKTGDEEDCSYATHANSGKTYPQSTVIFEKQYEFEYLEDTWSIAEPGYGWENDGWTYKGLNLNEFYNVSAFPDTEEGIVDAAKLLIDYYNEHFQ